jgi:GNAT superfamily N-acetyltransferase
MSMSVSYIGSSLEVDPANDIFRLASSVYSSTTLLPASTLSGWYERNSEVFWIARDGEKLVAYMTMLPLSHDAFASTLEPQFDEKGLSASDVLRYSKDGDYFGFVSSIVVHPDYRGSGVSRELRAYFLDTLVNWWTCGRRIVRLSAEALNDRGASMMESLGLSEHVRSDHGSIILSAICNDMTLKRRRDTIRERMDNQTSERIISC